MIFKRRIIKQCISVLVLHFLFNISVANDEESSILESATDVDENQRAYNVGELISFASFDFSHDPFTSNSSQISSNNISLFDNEIFDPFNLYGSSTTSTNNNQSTFHDDPFSSFVNETRRELDSSLSLFSSPMAPQLFPTSFASSAVSQPISTKETLSDLFDFNEPERVIPAPPESPKFDPYA